MQYQVILLDDFRREPEYGPCHNLQPGCGTEAWKLYSTQAAALHQGTVEEKKRENNCLQNFDVKKNSNPEPNQPQKSSISDRIWVQETICRFPLFFCTTVPVLSCENLRNPQCQLRLKIFEMDEGMGASAIVFNPAVNIVQPTSLSPLSFIAFSRI